MQSNANRITVHLYGMMKKRFGGPYTLAVDDPPAALRLLEANFPGRFLRYLRSRQFHVSRGTKFGDRTLPEGTSIDTFQSWFKLGGSDDIHIVPVTAGASTKGIILTVIGTVLVATALFVAFGPAGSVAAAYGSAGASLFGVSSSTIAMVGIALISAGIMNLITPVQKTDQGPGGTTGLFGAPGNTAAQGGPVPVIYGKVRAGAVVVSAGIHLDQAPIFSSLWQFSP